MIIFLSICVNTPAPEQLTRNDQLPYSGKVHLRLFKPYTIRERRYKREEEILGLPQIQYDILCNVSENVKPGGILVYSTCTVLKEENEDVVHRFLSDHSGFELVQFTTFGQSCDGMFTYWPQLHHTDGFFVCKMKKTN